MASLYPKKRSPFWYIRYADPLTGKPKDESTRLRRDDPEQTRSARQQCAQRTADELSAPAARHGEDWESWVDAFFVVHYPNPLTLQRARAAWFNLSIYLRSKRISAPRYLHREHCMNYLSWRIGPEARALGLRKAKHNTARVELQFLSAIMREAVYRNKASANPVLQLGIGRVPGKIKPEFTEDQMEVIEARLKAEAGQYDYNPQMQIAWAISIRHSTRITETRVDLNDVDLKERTITFHVKGGRDQTKLLHPELVPLFRRLKRQGHRYAYEQPKNWSKKWIYFFRRCGFKEHSFHSTRITGVNILRRKGVDPRTAREYVGHSSVIVNRGYERWRPDDHAAAVNALSRSSPSARARSSNARRRKRSR